MGRPVGTIENRNMRRTGLLAFLPAFLFASSSAVLLYMNARNVTVLAPPQDVILPTLVAILVAVLVSLIAWGMTREAWSAGAISVVFVLGLLYLWPLFIGILGLAGLILLVVRIVLKRLSFQVVQLVLTGISLAVFGYYAYRFAAFVLGLPERSYVNPTQPVVSPAEGTAPAGRPPDVYYIILDAYGRADMLQTIHGYDNSAFIQSLEERGFVVAAESRANYARTLLSLASSLNMQYLDALSAQMGESPLWWPIKDTLQHSQIRVLLEQEGYRTVFVASGWDLTDFRDGDYYLKPQPLMLNGFPAAFFGWTNLSVLKAIPGMGMLLPSDDFHRALVLYGFDVLPSTASLPGPKFVFAHILAPHPPYVFDSQGKPVDHDYPIPGIDTPGYSEYSLQYRRDYLEQLTFVNRKTLEMIDGILAASPTPPVIIIQGDHGPAVFIDYDDPSKACLYERYSILNAYHLPGVAPASVPADITPVNSFRLVLNQYFGTHLDYLTNLSYYSSTAQTYRFRDVTDWVSTPCELPAEFRP
jgi:hypothetical protein